MKTFYKILALILLGLLAFRIVVAAGTPISVPSSNGSGFLLQSLTNGTYSPVSLTAGSNVTISTTTSNITISSTGGGSSFGQTFELFTNIFSQSALTPTTTQNIHISGTGTSTFVGGIESWRQISAPYFQSTSTEVNKFRGNIQVSTTNASPLLQGGGSETDPAFSFVGDTDTGVYRSGGNTLDFSTGATRRAYIDSSGILNLINGFVSQASSTIVGLTNLRYSSTTGQSTFNHASTTTFTLGGITGSAWSDFCTSITGGAGLCDGSDDGGAGTSAFEIATTSDIGLSQLSYFTKTTGRTTLGGVATTTLVAGSGLSFGGATPVILGSSPITISATGGSGSGNVSTSTNETSGTLAYWTSNSATPALLGKVSTTSLSFSGFPASLSGTLGKLVGGTDSTWTWWGLATTTQPSSSNLLVSNGGQGVYGVATSTLTASSPLTGSFIQLGSGGSLGCQTASGSQAGCLSSTDWTTFNNKLTALGSGYATTTGSNISFSTSTLSFNGLTIGQTIVPSAGALTFSPTITGTLNNSGLTNSTISGISLGSNLADLTATNNSLTFSGTYNGSTARTIGLNLTNISNNALFTWNGTNLVATGTPQLTVGNLLATSTTATSTFMGNVYIGDGTNYGFVTGGQPLEIVATTNNVWQSIIANRSTGANAMSGYTLANLNSTNNVNPFLATYYAGMYMAGSSFSTYPGLLANDLVLVNSDGNLRFASISSNTASSSMTWSVGPGFSSANYDMALVASSTRGLGFLGIGTTTPRLPLSVNSTTTPQLSLLDGVNAGWSFRNAGGNLYLASTSATTFSTTTTSAFSILNSGEVIVRNLFQIFNVAGTKIMDVAGNAVTLLGAWDFGGADSVELPNGASPTVDATGETAIDTTSDQFIYYGASSKRVLTPFRYFTFTYSTTTAWNGTTTIDLAPAYRQQTWQGVKCFTNTGTVNVSFYDGTNRMNMLNASTTVGTFLFTTNNQFTASEKRYVDIGTPASTPQKISCEAELTIDAD